ncbi:MAG: hypothetical protein RBS80_09385 [Thermoguttaceae bacterium]|jgi:hypothetical protein|nr:hypothetical protein [Thermoguttaceae bacterium]
MLAKLSATICLALTVAFGVVGLPAADHEPRLVGDWSDPNRLEIRGSQVFSAVAIRSAVLLDDDVTLDAHPAANLAAYVGRIRQRVLAGYRRAGFPEASVDVFPEEETRRLVVHVAEGPRFTAGEVEVVGTATIPADALVARLSEPYPPTRALSESISVDDGASRVVWVNSEGLTVELWPPVWPLGQPAPFPVQPMRYVDAPPSALQRAIASALADLGYPFAGFEHEILLDPEHRLARLQIRLLDEGPSPILQHIEITGNQRNSREEIVQYLGLQPGTPIDQGALASLHRALWRSGRFLSWDIKPARLSPGCDDARAASKEGLALHIEVCENPHGPRLSEELTAEARILLKARDWLADPKGWGGDLVIEGAWPKAAGAGVVVSPGRGWILWVRDPTEEDLYWPFHHAVTATTDAVLLHSLAHGTRLDLCGDPGTVTGRFAFVLEPSSEDKGFRVRLGLLYDWKDAEEEPRVLLDLKLAPAAFLALAHDPDVRCEIHDDVLSVSAGEGRHFQADAATGRVIEVLSRPDPLNGSDAPARTADAPGGAAEAPDDPTESAPAPPEDSDAAAETASVRLYFEPGAFERREAEVLAAAVHGPEPGAAHPARSVALFLLTEWLGPGTNPPSDDTRLARQAIEAMVARGVFDPLEEALLKAWAPGDAGDSFRIPVEIQEDMWGPYIRPRAARLVDGLFPRRSWPWTAIRSMVLRCAGETQWAWADVNCLYHSAETGPLCCLVAANLLRHSTPAAARAFSDLGLERLSLQRFRDDCRPLLDDRGAIGRCLAGAAESVRTMDETEIEALAAALPAPYGEYLAEARRVLRRDPDRQTKDALGEVLDRLWEVGLKNQLQAALQGLDVRFAATR